MFFCKRKPMATHMRNYKLHLIRHGLTQGNIDGIYVGGGLDVPLCAEGEAQLREMALRYQYPNVGVVFSSPMQRALQSAEILYPHAKEKIVLEKLRENVFGEFEGQKAADLMQNQRFAQWLDAESGFVPEGGESGKDFAQRVVQALGEMWKYMMDNGVFEAACVTHGGVIMQMMSQKALPRKAPAQWLADNGAGFTVQTSASMLMRDDAMEAAAIVPAGYMD